MGHGSWVMGHGACSGGIDLGPRTLDFGLWTLVFFIGFLLSIPAGAQSIGEEETPAFENLTELERYLANRPGDHQARRQYADKLYVDGRFQEAAVQYEIFLQHLQGAPDTVHRYLMAIAGYPGDNWRGERAAEHYLGFYPTDHELLMRLGYFRLWQGKYNGAVEAFQQALRYRPDHEPSREGLGEAQAGIELRNRLDTPPPTDVSDPSEYPQLDERRYRFIYELLNHQRYFSAYEQLMLLADRHDHTNRWLALYTEIDRLLVEATGTTPAFPIDRYSYLLSLQPDNRIVRYALVDALIENDRLEEAYETLLTLDHVDVQDSGFIARLNTLDDWKADWLEERIERLEDELEIQPDNEATLSQLAAFYQVARRPEDALCIYERWLALEPDAHEVRFEYARLLLDLGRAREAHSDVEKLVMGDSLNIDYIRLFTRASLMEGGDEARAISLLQAHLNRNTNDVDVLLDLAEIYLSIDDPQQADLLLRRAFTLGEPSDRNRLLYLDRQIEQALRRHERRSWQLALANAREKAQHGNYEEAIAGYESYFELKGVRTRPVLEELARIYALSGDHTMAVSIFEALQQYGYTASVAKEIARNRYYLTDHAGAIEELEAVVQKNPRDFEARELLQQIYHEVQRFAQADTTYHAHITEMADNTRLEGSYSERLIERINLIERAINTDYVGLVVPVSQYIRARGSITDYEHWGQGLMTQVTLPAKPRPFMITAGLISHFLRGTRRLLPGTPFSIARVNQVMAGTYFDLTAPEYDRGAGYTNRLWLQLGLFDYAGSRTTGFWDLRYLKKKPDRYTASIGARSTEGAVTMWSPAGGEFGLRLTQFDADIRSVHILADSLIRVRADVAVNLVKGLRDSTLAGRRHNVGTDARFEASIRFLPHSYVGLAYSNIDYRYTLDTYFSPKSYLAYDLWLEYENEILEQWFWRFRGTSGLISYRRRSFAARVETDLIYRFSPHLSISISGSAGYSVRFVNGEESLRDNRFRTYLFTGALYWTL